MISPDKQRVINRLYKVQAGMFDARQHLENLPAQRGLADELSQLLDSLISIDNHLAVAINDEFWR